MKLPVIIILLLTSITIAFSQSTIDMNPKVSIQTDMDIDYMLEKHTEKNDKTDEIEGYRIQVMYSNDRSLVYEKKSEVYENFRQFKSYLVYEQPYYKLRIGDFETKLEARKYLEVVIEEFPTAFIVFDRIKL